MQRDDVGLRQRLVHGAVLDAHPLHGRVGTHVVGQDAHAEARAAPGDLVAVFTAVVPGAVEVYRAAFRAVSRAPKLD